MTNKELVMKLEEDISWLEQGCTEEREICEHIKQAIKTIMQHKDTDTPWHTGTPTEEGWYLIEVKDWEKQRVYYVPDYVSVHDLVLPTIQSFYESHLWQKIELSDEAKDLERKSK